MRRAGIFASRRDGVALIIVLWVIMVLSLLIGGFAFTMDVETKVASFSRKELKAEMLARSGVEVAKMELLLHDKSPDAGFDAPGQLWATNEDMYVDHPLGEGKYTVTVTDEERKLPANLLTQAQWRSLMEVLQVDASEADTMVDSILDWTQPGDLHRLNGAKNEYYENLSPPYECKEAPLDRLEELLLVRGVTRELFEGKPPGDSAEDTGTPGLRDVLTVWSAGQVNVNTADSTVLQALLGVDASRVESVLQHRDGPDGIPGTEDDMPFHSVDEFFTSLGNLNPNAAQQARALVNVSSQFFHIKSVGEVNGARYTIDAIVRRENGKCLVASWSEKRGGT